MAKEIEVSELTAAWTPSTRDQFRGNAADYAQYRTDYPETEIRSADRPSNVPRSTGTTDLAFGLRSMIGHEETQAFDTGIQRTATMNSLGKENSRLPSLRGG